VTTTAGRQLVYEGLQCMIIGILDCIIYVKTDQIGHTQASGTNYN